VLIRQGDGCRGEATRNFAAYHDGAVFAVAITSKIDPPKYCAQKRKFGESNFAERAAALKTELGAEENSGNNISADSVIKLTGKNKVVRLVNDYRNKRWFELSVQSAEGQTAAGEKFLASLETGGESAGIPIGPGAEKTFGDDPAAHLVDAETVDEKGEKTNAGKRPLYKAAAETDAPLTLAIKPRASYTEAARQAGIQGTVVLKVVFMANGGIGSVVVVRGLPLGLTEEAVKAAVKMFFLPARRAGARYSVVKTVEYNFSIY
jgi:TonB family protein